jgi:hypothetical protein
MFGVAPLVVLFVITIVLAAVVVRRKVVPEACLAVALAAGLVCCLLAIDRLDSSGDGEQVAGALLLAGGSITLAVCACAASLWSGRTRGTA